MQLLFAVKLGRLVWQHEYECSLKWLARKKETPSPSDSPPSPKPKHSRHYSGEYPTGFQPNTPDPEEAEAPTEPEGPE